MQPLAATRVPSEASDEVGLIIALLVRFPQLATIVSHPANGTLVLSFAVRSKLDRRTAADLRESICEHVRSLLELRRERHDALGVACESDEALGFVRITRDVRSFSREELLLLVALLSDRFGASLVQSPPTSDEPPEDEAAVDDLVEYAIEAFREPAQQRSLVGFREEKRVLVYFVKSRKKAKARARP
jgi:hypothetical protein